MKRVMFSFDPDLQEIERGNFDSNVYAIYPKNRESGISSSRISCDQLEMVLISRAELGVKYYEADLLNQIIDIYRHTTDDEQFGKAVRNFITTELNGE